MKSTNLKEEPWTERINAKLCMHILSLGLCCLYILKTTIIQIQSGYSFFVFVFYTVRLAFRYIIKIIKIITVK